MRRKRRVHKSPFIRMILAIFVLLLLIYIPLKIYIARSGEVPRIPDGTRLSIFVTNELKGYREPCG
ncbi:MAG: hypothetical protein JXB45_01565 [Candidatus Krumholzibacteriota bacterium]|nr:hypothetical protein [Candidatus Krumholzibacteriota bacterium]